MRGQSAPRFTCSRGQGHTFQGQRFERNPTAQSPRSPLHHGYRSATQQSTHWRCAAVDKKGVAPCHAQRRAKKRRRGTTAAPNAPSARSTARCQSADRTHSQLQCRRVRPSPSHTRCDRRRDTAVTPRSTHTVTREQVTYLRMTRSREGGTTRMASMGRTKCCTPRNGGMGVRCITCNARRPTHLDQAVRGCDGVMGTDANRQRVCCARGHRTQRRAADEVVPVRTTRQAFQKLLHRAVTAANTT